MTDQRFPLRRLPDDLGSMILNTMEYREIIAYSFLSKKAYSMVKDLRLPIFSVIMTMKKQPQIDVKLSSTYIKFELNMPENDEKMAHLNGFPVDVKVTYRKFENRGFSEKISTWTNQGKTFGEWIQHLCSINQPKGFYVNVFHVREIALDIQTLRNIFPKLGIVNIIFPQAESNKHDISSAQNVSKAFLLGAKWVQLERAPFQDHFSIQHIGMANLKWLEMRSPQNLNVYDLLSLNVERIYLHTDQLSLRDLNRFFKLWTKGSNPKLEILTVFWRTEIIPEWNVLLKGLKPEEVEEEGSRKYVIQNCRKVCAKIGCRQLSFGNFLIQFTVPTVISQSED
ncbi:hypothetical protein B9Z55_011152 [Caenorhabditis nigoni]|uniref:F-box domain-containing protein n=1 Tax=Caenorhabditis nigoni TaxID=1611254 RepID=A0A2G5UIV9_9PELO|nr:hypothetical protein B9Z55_011152 [Caenorhabditis nigoni]